MRSRLFLLAALPPTLTAFGTVGYRLVEGWSIFDSLYMTVITLTTIGFGEVHPLSPAGRVFTMFLSFGGIFTLFYAATELVRTWTTGELRKVLGRQRGEMAMNKLEDHVIVCGFGRMGRLVCQELSRVKLPYVVIDSEEARLADFSLQSGVALHGDATLDDTLKRAGIERARAVVVVLPSDADNLFITMSARLLDEKVTIVARAEEEASVAKLVRAGANRVISPFLVGGAQVAQAILQPSVLDFIDVVTRGEHIDLQLEEVLLEAKSALVGKTMKKSGLRSELNVIVVALKRMGTPMVFNPPEETILGAGDTLVVLGARPQLDKVGVMAAP
ncbi:MAG: potassium channel protein [Labilithrix sp.]